MKNYVSNFTIHLGPVSTTGKLIAVRLPKAKSTYSKPQLKYVSPNGNPVEQRYRDMSTGEIFEVAALSKASIDTDTGAATVVDEELLKEANTSQLPKDVMNVTVHRIKEVEDSIFPADRMVLTYL